MSAGIDIEEFRSAGKLPEGPVSAYPKSRNDELERRRRKAMASSFAATPEDERATKVKAGLGQQFGGLMKNTKQLVKSGTVSKKIRDERYDTCKSCPAFVERSKRCSDCGCFMEAKTWINGSVASLCPRKKWRR